jgi:phosphatidylinositol alpha-1,6-mannosyltransferase
MGYFVEIIIANDFFPMIGGAHTWLYEVFKRWPNSVTLITRNFNSDFDKQKLFDSANHGSIKIMRFESSARNIDIRDLKWLKEIYLQAKILKNFEKNNNATLYCLRALPEGLVAILTCMFRRKKTKLVIFAHGEDILISQTSRQFKIMAKIVYSQADIIISNSINTANLIKKYYRIKNIEIIHPGVDFVSYEVNKEQVREYRNKIGWQNDTVIVCTVARMEPRKNHLMVTCAIAELIKEGLNIGYICASDGIEKKRIIKMVKQLGIENYVKFTGTISNDEKLMIYAVSDIHAMPSIKIGEMIEGFGIVFIEAAAAGLASIAGNSGGQPEAVIDGVTGYIVNGNDLKSLKNAIRTLVRDKKLRHRMGKNAKEWAREHDWNKITKLTYKAING